MPVWKVRLLNALHPDVAEKLLARITDTATSMQVPSSFIMFLSLRSLSTVVAYDADSANGEQLQNDKRRWYWAQGNCVNMYRWIAQFAQKRGFDLSQSDTWERITLKDVLNAGV